MLARNVRVTSLFVEGLKLCDCYPKRHPFFAPLEQHYDTFRDLFRS